MDQPQIVAAGAIPTSSGMEVKETMLYGEDGIESAMHFTWVAMEMTRSMQIINQSKVQMKDGLVREAKTTSIWTISENLAALEQTSMSGETGAMAQKTIHTISTCSMETQGLRDSFKVMMM